MLTHGELFAGISGFGLGFAGSGIETLWHVEKDTNCQKVLRRHYPDSLLLSDIREVGAHNLPPVDIISMGFPCQGLSVAELRRGLADDRSGLFFEGLRVIYELQPDYAIWENVPGLLTSCSCRKCCRRCARCESIAGADDETCDVCGSDKFRGRVLPQHRGADFFTVISSFGFIGMDGAWTLLDAQFFGVPQRRRRLFGVFAQRHIGAERCTQILSFLNRREGHFTPGKTERPDVAAPITRSFASHHGRTAGNNGVPNNLITAHSVRPRSGMPQGWNSNLVAWDNGQGDPNGDDSGLAYALNGQANQGVAFGGNNTGGPINVACALNAHGSKRYDFESETFVTTAFNGYTGGADDNDAQGNHLVVAGTLPADYGKQGGNGMGEMENGIVATFDPRNVTSKANRTRVEDGLPANTLHQGGLSAISPSGVRRLTPVECNRLQGFPDSWNEWGLDEQGQRVELSDSARYRQAGNAVAVPCAQWLGRQMLELIKVESR